MKNQIATLTLFHLAAAAVPAAAAAEDAISAELDAALVQLEAGVELQEFADAHFRALRTELERRIDRANVEDPAGIQVRTRQLGLVRDLESAAAEEIELGEADWIDLRAQIITDSLRRSIRHWRDQATADHAGRDDYQLVIRRLGERHEATKGSSPLADNHFLTARRLADDIQARLRSQATTRLDFDLLEERIVEQRLARVIDRLERRTLDGWIEADSFERWTALIRDRYDLERPYYEDGRGDAQLLTEATATVRDMAVAGSARPETFRRMRCLLVATRLRRGLSALATRAPRGITPAWWRDVEATLDEGLACAGSGPRGATGRALHENVRADIERLERLGKARDLATSDFARMNELRAELRPSTVEASFERR